MEPRNALVGYDVRGPDDEFVGTVTSVWSEERTLDPALVAVRLGTGEARLAPMRDSVVDGTRRLVRFPYREDLVRAAPAPTASDIAVEDVVRVLRHYGFELHPARGPHGRRRRSVALGRAVLGEEFEVA